MVMKSLGEILKKHIPQSPVGKQINATMVVEKANQVLQQVLGMQAAKFAQAIYFKDTVIAITCLSSVMAQEIKLHEQKIIALINNGLQSKTITKIRYLA